MLRMGYIPRRCWAFYRSPLGKKLYRYVMGSVITTVISFGVLTLVYGVLHLWGAVLSTVFANVVATVPAYWLNRTWTWGKAGRSDPWAEVTPFWVLSIIGIAASMGTAQIASDLTRQHHLEGLTATILVDAANLFAYGVLFVGKYLVFNRLFAVASQRHRSGSESGAAAMVPAAALQVVEAPPAPLEAGASPTRTPRISAMHTSRIPRSPAGARARPLADKVASGS